MKKTGLAMPAPFFVRRRADTLIDHGATNLSAPTMSNVRPATRGAATSRRAASGPTSPRAAKTGSTKVLRDVLLAFVRIHILHHAAEGHIFGLDMMEELRRHGYAIGPGTLYPLLHALEREALLQSTEVVSDGRLRRYYRITRSGRSMLSELRAKLRELLDEVLE
jgi:PadR family transcriptional regulator, regulatory protein PadR